MIVTRHKHMVKLSPIMKLEKPVVITMMREMLLMLLENDPQ